MADKQGPMSWLVCLESVDLPRMSRVVRDKMMHIMLLTQHTIRNTPIQNPFLPPKNKSHGGRRDDCGSGDGRECQSDYADGDDFHSLPPTPPLPLSTSRWSLPPPLSSSPPSPSPWLVVSTSLDLLDFLPVSYCR